MKWQFFCLLFGISDGVTIINDKCKTKVYFNKTNYMFKLTVWENTGINCFCIRVIWGKRADYWSTIYCPARIFWFMLECICRSFTNGASVVNPFGVPADVALHSSPYHHRVLDREERETATKLQFWILELIINCQGPRWHGFDGFSQTHQIWEKGSGTHLILRKFYRNSHFDTVWQKS